MDILKLTAIILAIGLLAAGAVWAIGNVQQAECVSVLSIDGPIGLQPAPGQASSRAIASALEDFKNGPSKALLVEINSPGGSAVASAEIYQSLRELDEANKTTVAYLSEIAASGGYYSAAGTQYVVANPDTITGSIGAVTDLVNYEELLRKVGVQQYAIKSGALKDIGAPYRNMTDAERQLLQGLINESAARFVADVRDGRQGKLKSAFDQLLDARIVSAQTALDAGLVDEIGTRKDALAAAAELSGMNGTDLPSECDITPESPLPLSDFFSGLGASMAKGFTQGLQSQSQMARVAT